MRLNGGFTGTMKLPGGAGDTRLYEIYKTAADARRRYTATATSA